MVRSARRLALAAMVVAVCLLAEFVIGAIVIPEIARTGYLGSAVDSTPSALDQPSPSASDGLTMNGVPLPADTDCSGCHLTDSGVIGLRPIPAMGHPLEGWSECTACHAPASLVRTAPGHSGIHAADCLTCHQPGSLPAPLSRPHRDRQNTACLECHGSKAPLPADMAHRSQSVCWLCHRLADVPPPIPAHSTASGQADCLVCHVAGKVGALPADHVRRPAAECLLCHEAPLGASTSSRASSPEPS